MKEHNRQSDFSEPAAQTELQGMTAVVTGSSSGIGRAIAIELAKAGAAVVVHARKNRSGGEDVVRSIESVGGVATLLLCDLADSSAFQTFVNEAWNWRGGLDIWINNAGADVLTGSAAQLSFEEKLEILWRVDVAATIRLSRLAGHRMKARGRGSIINIGWDQSEHGMAGDSGEMFGATKGAVTAFTKSLAQTLAPEVRVNCVAPGWIKTSWGQNASAYWQERACRDSLLGRWGTPDDVARVIRFAVSPAAGFMTGQILTVNGGFRFGGY